MRTREKNELLRKLNEYLSPYASAEMRDGLVSIKVPDSVPGRTEYWQCTLKSLRAEIVAGFDLIDDAGLGVWSIGEGFVKATSDVVGSDPYTRTTKDILRYYAGTDAS